MASLRLWIFVLLMSAPQPVLADNAPLLDCPDPVLPAGLVQETVGGQPFSPEQRCILANNPDINDLPPEKALHVVNTLLSMQEDLQSLDPNVELPSTDLEDKLRQIYFPDALPLFLLERVERNQDLKEAVLRTPIPAEGSKKTLLSTVGSKKIRDLFDIIFPKG